MNSYARLRLLISGRIAHSRKMINWEYHADFFKRLLIKQQKEQAAALKEERKDE